MSLSNKATTNIVGLNIGFAKAMKRVLFSSEKRLDDAVKETDQCPKRVDAYVQPGPMSPSCKIVLGLTLGAYPISISISIHTNEAR